MSDRWHVARASRLKISPALTACFRWLAPFAERQQLLARAAEASGDEMALPPRTANLAEVNEGKRGGRQASHSGRFL